MEKVGNESNLDVNIAKYEFKIVNSPEAIIIADYRGKIIDASDRYCEITGYSKKELLHENISNIKFNTGSKITLRKIWDELNLNKPISTYYGTLTIKNGRKIYISAQSSQVYSQGQPLILTLIHDITKYEKTEQLLIESEEKYKTLFNSNPDYRILLNQDMELLELNEAAIKTVGPHFDQYKEVWIDGMGKILPEDNPENLKKSLMKIINLNQSGPVTPKLIDKNGNTQWFEIYLTPIRIDEKIIGYQGSGHNLTTLKMAEKELKNSLMEKEILLREIHHRVKNNMQIISSLLNLQSSFIKDPKAIEAFHESQTRIQSMAMVHEQLYQSGDLTQISIQDYILKLVNNLFYSYGIRKDQITMVTEISDIKLNLETVLPCGLILCEVISNSLKYAFPEGEGEIRICLEFIDDTLHLTISDNGIGLTENDYLENKSLGIQLIQTLTDQLDGELELDIEQGTQYKISFKEAEYRERI
ncbi:histidine kinase dimerization/phosphoacceptor domain -containing protein [uncultured Methanobacterium sp.]|uniref:PAS domain-containing sensor histidine kinase n=1 Tax=uncultured Methanobacterium sp. TaxID=176306 RepID=UPI002AA6443B|nr:histidine kinase dimerization/phosphoacceptor domain -containing protein [uncultured Methanobacterium sp.]